MGNLHSSKKAAGSRTRGADHSADSEVGGWQVVHLLLKSGSRQVEEGIAALARGMEQQRQSPMQPADSGIQIAVCAVAPATTPIQREGSTYAPPYRADGTPGHALILCPS